MLGFKKYYIKVFLMGFIYNLCVDIKKKKTKKKYFNIFSSKKLFLNIILKFKKYYIKVFLMCFFIILMCWYLKK